MCTGSYEAASMIAAHRCASAVSPVIIDDPARQHRERRVLFYCHIPDCREPPLSISRSDPRCNSAGPTRSVAPRIGRARRYSTSALVPCAGDPFDSYQSAARKCSFAMTSGSSRRSSPSKNSRNNAWYRYQPRRRSSGTRNRFDASSCVAALTRPDSPRSASHSGPRQLVQHCRAPQETLHRPQAVASATRGTGSQPDIDRLPRPRTLHRLAISFAISAAR